MPTESPLKDFQSRYILPSAVLFASLKGAAAVYEIWWHPAGSWSATGIEIAKWTSPCLATSTVILLFKEVLDMVTRRRYIEEGRKEERQEWQSWLERRDAAARAGQPFDEPSPAERDRAKDQS